MSWVGKVRATVHFRNLEGAGPEPWILLAASVGTDAGFCVLRFSGPAATVEGWREELIQLLKELRPRK
jgi:hypothetical protein